MSMTSSRRLSRNPRDAVGQGLYVHQNSWDNYGLTNVLYSRPVRHAFSLSRLVSSLGVRRVEPPPLSSAKVGDALSSPRGVTRQELEQTLSLLRGVTRQELEQTLSPSYVELQDRSWNELSLPPTWSYKTGAGTNSLSLLRGVTRRELEKTLSPSLLSLAEWRSGFKLYGPAGCSGSFRVESRSTMQGPQD